MKVFTEIWMRESSPPSHKQAEELNDLDGRCMMASVTAAITSNHTPASSPSAAIPDMLAVQQVSQRLPLDRDEEITRGQAVNGCSEWM